MTKEEFLVRISNIKEEAKAFPFILLFIHVEWRTEAPQHKYCNILVKIYAGGLF